MRTKLFVIVAVWGMGFSLMLSEAQASIRLSLVGALNFSAPALQSSTQTQGGATANITGTSASIAAGVGVLGDYSLLPNLELELGFLYMPRQYMIDTTVSGSAPVTGQLVTYFFEKKAQIPLLVRFWPLSFLSVGAGGYFEQGIGDIAITPALSSTTDYESYEFEGINRSDFGLIGSVQSKVMLGAGLNWIADLRYVFGLTNVDTSGTPSYYYRDVQFLTGIGIEL